MEIYELTTIHDARKSFYHKAIVKIDGTVKRLYSYETLVAWIDESGAHVKALYSATTTRHIKEFLKQHGFKADSGKQMIEDYPV